MNLTEADTVQQRNAVDAKSLDDNRVAGNVQKYGPFLGSNFVINFARHDPNCAAQAHRSTVSLF